MRELTNAQHLRSRHVRLTHITQAAAQHSGYLNNRIDAGSVYGHAAPVAAGYEIDLLSFRLIARMQGVVGQKVFPIGRSAERSRQPLRAGEHDCAGDRHDS